MKGNTTLKIYWNKNKENFDLIIYVPHDNRDKNFIKNVRETSKNDIKNISDDLLFEYLYHEADSWVSEILSAMEKYFLNEKNFKIWVLRVEIPRGFCDLNRPLERAIPNTFRDKYWEDLYEKTQKEVFEILEKADFVFQFHSMNSFNPIEKAGIDEEISENFLTHHLEKIYCWEKRVCTLLTEDENWEYLTNKIFDEIFRKKFEENNIELKDNNAYRLLSDYPCTKIIKNQKSSFFEVIKWSLATKETENEINTNKIIFDEKKVEFFAKILSEIIFEYLEKTKKIIIF